MASDLGVVVKATKEVITTVRNAVKPPDGSEGNSWAWIGAALGSLPAAWVGIKKYLDARSALKASVAGAEAVAEKHPEAALTFKSAAASSGYMGAGPAALIGALKHLHRRKP